MSTRTCTDLALELWEAIAEGDADRTLATLAPEVTWESVGENPLAGRHVGPNAVLDYLAEAGEMTDELRTTLRGVYASESGAVLHYHTDARRRDRSLTMDYLLLLNMESGRIVHAKLMAMDQRENDRFWSASTP